MSYAMPLMMTIACTHMGISPEEAITACTLNGAAALRRSTVEGSVEVGKNADLIVAEVPDYAAFARLIEGSPFFVSQVRSVAELAETDWATERGVFRELEPGVRVVGAAYRSREADIGARGPAPRPGEHTRAVLHEELDIDDDALDALFASGAVF